MSAVTPQTTSSDAIWQKLKPHKFVTLFAAALAIFFVIALVVILIVKPGAVKPPCEPHKACGKPPGLPAAVKSAAAARPFVAGKVWKSSELGYSLEYDPGRWKVVKHDARGAVLSWSIPSRPDLDLTLIVKGAPLSEAAPAQLLQGQISGLKGDVLGLKGDNSADHAILGPNVGYVDQQAVGGPYAGTLDTPQGPGPRIALSSMAATDGKISVAVTAATASGEQIRLPLMNEADSVLNTLRWPAGAEAQARLRRLSFAPLSRPHTSLVTAKTSDQFLGRTDPKKTLGFSLVLRFRQAALDRYLAQVQDPKSPNYRHYLTAKQIGERFGISRAEIARVRKELLAAGFRVDVVYPQRTAIRARGSVGRISTFFRTSLGDFKDAKGRIYHQPLRKPTIPSTIRRSVVGVAGLSNKSLPIPAGIPGGGLTPKLTAKAYNVLPLHKLGLHGEGQTVAIVSFDSFNDSDVRAFDRQFKIVGPKVKHRKVLGGSEVGSGADEVNLDIDTIRSIAPKAQIIDYEGANGSVGFGDMLNAIIADGKADIVSISWGSCDDITTLSPDERRNTEQALRTAVARGISIFVASGDAGAFECQRAFLDNHRLTTSFPSNAP
jgi:hypothetical protein